MYDGLEKPHWLGSDNHYHVCPYCGKVAFFYYLCEPDTCPNCHKKLHRYTPEEALAEVVARMEK